MIGRPQYESTAWFLTVQKIGDALKDRYRAPAELPPEMPRLIEQLSKMDDE